jgi:hypothetical protein
MSLNLRSPKYVVLPTKIQRSPTSDEYTVPEEYWLQAYSLQWIC